MLAELRAERDQLTEAILVLERLAAGLDDTRESPRQAAGKQEQAEGRSTAPSQNWLRADR